MIKLKEQILILAKTYPSPSSRYVETSCVAGINENGLMRRLYPVPFRMVEQNKQFRKWQWIEVIIEKSNKDNRAESHKIYIDTIKCGNSIDTKNGWLDRRAWLRKLPYFNNFSDIEINCSNNGQSLVLLHPKQLIDLEIIKARNEDWTDEEKQKLVRGQMQGSLFSEFEATREVTSLRKIPFDFYYRYSCVTNNGEVEYRHKIVDWEAGSLFWNCRKKYGPNWEEYFRKKLKDEFSEKDLMFVMGNIHRFQNQWLIISLIYPPKHKQIDLHHPSLF